MEWLEEDLEPIPESYVIKDPILINEFRSRMPSFQQEFRRGVPTPNFQWWN